MQLIKNVTLCSVVLVLLLSISGCYSEDRFVSHHSFKSGNVEITVEHASFTPATKESKRYPLSNLFDKDRNTAWHSSDKPDLEWRPINPGCSSRLLFRLSENSYLKSLNIQYPSSRSDFNGKNILYPKNIIITTYPFDDESQMFLFGDSFAVELDTSSKTQKILFSQSDYSGLLKSKIIDLSIIDCHKNKNGKKLAIGEISIQISSRPNFNPSMTLKKIKNKINTDKRFVTLKSGKWYMKTNPIDPDPLLGKIKSNLIYASLNGSKEAERIFYNYSPAGTYSDEGQYVLREWYEITSKGQK